MKVDHRVEQAHGSGIAPLVIEQAAPVYKARDHVGGFQDAVVVEQNDLFIAHAHHAAHAQDQQNDDRGGNARQGDVQRLLPAARAIDARGFVQFLVDARERGQVNDGAPADFLPDAGDHIKGHEILRVGEHGALLDAKAAIAVG